MVDLHLADLFYLFILKHFYLILFQTLKRLEKQYKEFPYALHSNFQMLTFYCNYFIILSSIYLSNLSVSLCLSLCLSIHPSHHPSHWLELSHMVKPGRLENPALFWMTMCSAKFWVFYYYRKGRRGEWLFGILCHSNIPFTIDFPFGLGKWYVPGTVELHTLHFSLIMCLVHVSFYYFLNKVLFYCRLSCSALSY